jgi:hypothetical protein
MLYVPGWVFFDFGVFRNCPPQLQARFRIPGCRPELWLLASSAMEEELAPPAKRRRGLLGRAVAIMQQKRFQGKGGSEAYYVATAGMRQGPMDLKEFMSWPNQQLRDLQAANPLYACRVQALYQFGLVLHTDFSGKQCPETVFRMQERAFAHEGFQLPAKFVSSWRSCDNARLCQKVMCNSAAPPLHVFQDLFCRLPPAHQKQVAAMRPPPLPRKPSPEEVVAASDAYGFMGQFLLKRSEEIFRPGATSKGCLLHPGESCPVMWNPQAAAEAADVHKQDKPKNNETNKQTDKQTNKQSNMQTHKTNKPTNEGGGRWVRARGSGNKKAFAACSGRQHVHAMVFVREQALLGRPSV